MEVVNKVERITGIHRNDFPIIYLGCPIFYARRKLEFYQPLITKVMDKLQSWQGKLLSVGGRAVLISHVLQSMPMHLLSAVNPPKYVINRLHKLFAQFSWSSTVGGTSRHWASWNTLCMPVEEGGIGFRSLHDVAKALFSKLWWNFRTKPSLWSSFPDEESLQHLFFRSETAKTTWKYFLSRAGIDAEGFTLHQAITKYWTANVRLRLKPLMQALPSWALVKVRKPGIDMVPHKWQDLLAMMENFTPKLKVTKVMWEFPSTGWLKVNTDGASRGNPGRSSI
uniref:Uncharacterized protein LOC104234194 n=1 Tax=Nicotiana sylvestris TaxID=4096 RepID=A0A1U7X1L2_NICSY